MGTRNYWHEHKHASHQHISKYANMHIDRKHTGGNPEGSRPTKAKVSNNTGLATK